MREKREYYDIFAINFDLEVILGHSWYCWKCLVTGYDFCVLSFARFLIVWPRRAFFVNMGMRNLKKHLFKDAL